MNKNEMLSEVQKIWEEQCYAALKSTYLQNEMEKGKLSCAFALGLSEHYLGSEKKVMVIGQEAKGHTFEYDKWNLENWQKWAIDYLNFQIYREQSESYKFTPNNSPFWQFMRKLKEGGYDLCWNNLDKVRRYIHPDGKEWAEGFLPYDKKKKDNSERAALNKKIFDGRSLLQKEIEIAAPDFVVFACGPKDPYYHTLCNAFFGDGADAYQTLNDKRYYPTSRNEIVEISQKLGLNMPAYYTYHPNYLQLRGRHELDRVIDELIRRFQTRMT